MTSALSRAVDLVGVAEIAGRLDISRHTVQSWRRRHPDFPRPLAELQAGPVWSWPDVEVWVRHERRTGRPRGTEIVATVPWSGYRGPRSMQVAVAEKDRGAEAVALVHKAIAEGAW